MASKAVIRDVGRVLDALRPVRFAFQADSGRGEQAAVAGRAIEMEPQIGRRRSGPRRVRALFDLAGKLEA